jgi:hypothetical protein
LFQTVVTKKRQLLDTKDEKVASYGRIVTWLLRFELYYLLLLFHLPLLLHLRTLDPDTKNDFQLREAKI